MSKELDIVPIFSSRVSSVTDEQFPNEKRNSQPAKEKTSDIDEKSFDGEGEAEQESQLKELNKIDDFPWRWKLTALALGVFLSGKFGFTT